MISVSLEAGKLKQIWMRFGSNSVRSAGRISALRLMYEADQPEGNVWLIGCPGMKVGPLKFSSKRRHLAVAPAAGEPETKSKKTQRGSK